MLAALLANNNNVQPLRTGFKVDPRASAGRSRRVNEVNEINDGGGQRKPSAFDIADIVTAAALFPEIASEDPAARAARRVRWISDALPFIKDRREKREAAAFLAGAQLADAAAEERHAQEQLKVEQIVEIIDAVRRETTAPVAAPPLPHAAYERGGHSSGGTGLGLFVGGLVVGGLLIGHALRKRAPRRRR